MIENRMIWVLRTTHGGIIVDMAFRRDWMVAAAEGMTEPCRISRRFYLTRTLPRLDAPHEPLFMRCIEGGYLHT